MTFLGLKSLSLEFSIVNSAVAPLFKLEGNSKIPLGFLIEFP